MDFNALKKNFEELNAQMEAARKEMAAKSTGFVEAACKQFFDACPEVESIFWTQYTPYFNDGEACEFGVHDQYYVLKDDDEADDYEGSVVWTRNNLEKAQKDLITAQEYNTSPDLWKAKYRQEYRSKYGREYPHSDTYLRPYPSDPVDAQERIDRIQEFLDKYTDEQIDNIEKCFKELTSAISMIDEDIMLAIYGDHVKVVITRDGTDIDEYDHD